jgi:hypothetical protein
MDHQIKGTLVAILRDWELPVSFENISDIGQVITSKMYEGMLVVRWNTTCIDSTEFYPWQFFDGGYRNGVRWPVLCWGEDEKGLLSTKLKYSHIIK